jgi:queuine tRNA-ribosyltransferase
MENSGISQTLRQANPTLGEYEIHTAREGFSSIRHVASGEIMHSRTPPMEEARRLYVEQSRLAERLAASPESSAPLVIWDVGLGAAANAMAAIECHEREVSGKTSSHAVRGLRIVSFENDLDSLRLALSHREKFPYLDHEAPQAILRNARWKSPKDSHLDWHLLAGSFTETMARCDSPPDLIFYDMFSRKTCEEAWLLGTFRDLFAICRGRGVEIFTYTCSTATRAAMLLAGFCVARGRNVGDKEETTIAFTPEALRDGSASRHELLGGEWLEKWKRSGARLPAEIPPTEQGALEKGILEHFQFR